MDNSTNATLASPPSSSPHKTSCTTSTRQKCNEICLFDIETNIFPIELIEFGCIVVDKFNYTELERYSTLIHPPSKTISKKATECHGITYAMVKDAPNFQDVADRLFDFMDGRIWMGHNIGPFDVKHIHAAFASMNHALPQPVAMIDTLPMIRRIFGKRAGDCKMATLGKYFGLGVEKHRAVEDCEMTLQAMKCIGLHYLLEREVGPDHFPPFQTESKQENEKEKKKKEKQNGKEKEPKKTEKDSKIDHADTIDQLSNKLADTKITIQQGESNTSASNGTKMKADSHPPPSTTKTTSTKPSAPHSPTFVDSSLLLSSTSSSSSSAVDGNSSANSSKSSNRDLSGSSDAGWQVAHSRKGGKHSKEENDHKTQMKKKEKYHPQSKQHFDHSSSRQVLPSSSSSTHSRHRSSSVGDIAHHTSSAMPSSASSSTTLWSNLVKGAPSVGPNLNRSLSNGTSSNNPQAHTDRVELNNIKAMTSQTALPSALSSSPSSTTTTTSSAATPTSTTDLTASTGPSPPSSTPSAAPSASASISSMIDHYVAHPHLHCSLTYSGGSNPGSIRRLTNLQWQKRPFLFKATIVGNRHGDGPVSFATAKCSDITPFSQS